MNIVIKEMEESGERMGDAVDKMYLLALMVGKYFEVCPHCLAIALAENFMEDEDDEPDEKEKPQ